MRRCAEALETLLECIGGRGGAVAALGVLAVVLAPAGAIAQQSPQPSPAQKPAAQPATQQPNAGTPAPAAGCDAACVRANTDRAVLACAPVIEAQSPTDFDWLTRPVPGIFQQAEQPPAQNFVVRYRGDSIRFQTQQKDWARMSYECGYDVEAKRVAFINMHPGRLQLPPSAATASVVLPGGPPGNPPMRNGRQMSALQGRVLPQGGPPQSMPSRKPPPRVGEPSPIQIEQQAPRVRP